MSILIDWVGREHANKYFMDCMQVVEQRLEFILLHAILLGDELFYVEKHVGAQLKNRLPIRPQRFDRLGLVAAPMSRVGHPVVVLECVDGLYDSADASNVDVNVQIVDELGSQIRVEFRLNLSLNLNIFQLMRLSIFKIQIHTSKISL